MAIWNAPEPVTDHPRMACLAAVRCRDASRALAKTPEWRGLPAFETRFGLHCANALVGHFGARDRMNYTAIGDAINLASRLEGLNKQYGTSIIASESVVERARDAFDFRLLDVVAVKGKSDAITIYEVLGNKGEAEERSRNRGRIRNCVCGLCSPRFRNGTGRLAKQPERRSERCADRTVHGLLAVAATAGVARRLRVSVEVTRTLQRGQTESSARCLGSASRDRVDAPREPSWPRQRGLSRERDSQRRVLVA